MFNKIKPMLAALAVAIFTFVPTLAFADDMKIELPEGKTADKILTNIGSIVMVIAVVIAIVWITVQVLKYIKGDSGVSLGKLAGEIAVILLLLGIVVMLINWKTIGNTFGSASNTLLNTTESISNDVIGSLKVDGS